jgi:hypothetical protein
MISFLSICSGIEGAIVTLAAARMGEPARPLRRGDRIACAFFTFDDCLDYRRGRVEEFSTAGRVIARFDGFRDRVRIEARCVALEEAAP